VVAVAAALRLPRQGGADQRRLARPGLGGIGTEAREGRESESAAAPSVLTGLTEKAASRNNEIAPAEL
jgi:hypothetical protein